MEISMDNLSMYEQQSWKFHSYLYISFLIVLFIFSGDVKCIFKCKKMNKIDDFENQLIHMFLLHKCQKNTHTFHF